MADFDAHLDDWLDVAAKHDWKGVLLGNGASMVLWPKFGYRTLFDVASSLAGPSALADVDQELFRRLRAGGNFERVLRDLAISARVADALDMDSARINERYTHIREALIEAVHSVHVPFNEISIRTLHVMAAYLRTLDSVFSTNYDLIIYWAIMRDRASFTDCFLHGELEPSLVRPGWTKVYYVHGALHLYRTLHGGPRKNQSSERDDLLRLFGRPIDGEEIFPEFVSEGTADQKLRAIDESPYLSFAFEQFEHFQKPLVVFGSGLGDQDEHIVRAIAQHGTRPVAMSIRPSDDATIIAEKHRYAGMFAGLTGQLCFFDSTTHPLGDPQSFVWGDPLTSDEIARQLGPIKTILLDCPACGTRAFVIGRRSQCWSCGYPVNPKRTVKPQIEQAIRAGAFSVLSHDDLPAPHICDQCGERTLVNVGLKRRGWRRDPFHCFHCGFSWPPGALDLCPRCGTRLFDRRVKGANCCSACV